MHTSILQTFICKLPDIPEQGISGCELSALAVQSFAIGLLIALFSLGILYILGRKKSFRGRNLMLPFAFTWLAGFIVYDVGMFTGNYWSLISNMPMAVIHAFKMFILESDISEIQSDFHESWIFMSFYSLAHFLAAAISLWFVIEHFGFNIVASVKCFLSSTCIAKAKDNVYVFWGVNDAAHHLAKSINAHHEQNGGTYRIIVIRSGNDPETKQKANGFERLFHFLSLNNKEIDYIRDIKACLTTSTFVSLSDLNLQASGETSDILSSLGLRRISRIIDRKTKGNVFVFFLSDNESTNIKSVTNLKQDSTLQKITKNRQVKFFCHARYNSINRVIEDIDITNMIETRIIDTSHMSIECLKRESRYQPVSFVDINPNYGTVDSPFTSLIVGFGETGRDALRFLYEFGAFVDSNTGKRSAFNCHIVDKQLGSIEGALINTCPRIFESRNTADGDDSLLVERHMIDYTSDTFYNDLLAKLADKLNYIVIAIGNDDAGMTLAVRIMKYLMRHGRNFDKLRIFVRSYESSQYSHMSKIAKHYNDNEERIVLFGNEEQLYSYGMVVEDNFEKRGKEYYEAYRSLNPGHDEDGTWEQRRRKLLGLARLHKTGRKDPCTGCKIFEEVSICNPGPTPLNSIQKLRRKEAQDKANAMHETTKIMILEHVMPKWLSELVPALFKFTNTGEQTIITVKREHHHDANPKSVKYTELTPKQQTLMDNLAKLEHLRWNASHEILGYRTTPPEIPDEQRGCDETRMTHNCLVDWEDLDKESDRIEYIDNYKIYDYSVVETTINIHRKRAVSQKAEELQ